METTFSAHDFQGLIPENLIRAFAARRCVIFAGSGLSSQAQTPENEPLPNWVNLLSGMIDWCIDQGIALQASPDELRQAIKRKRYLSVAEELQQSLGRRQNSCLYELLKADRAKPGEAHALLTKLPLSCVLTSNYDSLIEGAFAAKTGGVLPPVYSQMDLNQALNCLREQRFFVFKAHGDLNSTDSIVLGSRDYTRLLYLSPAYRSFLEAIFSSHTVLFVGFGGDDPDLDAVIDKLSTLYERGIGQHFILLPDDQFSAFERRRLLQDRRLDCITYTRDGNHSQFVEFLKALCLRTNSLTQKTAISERELANSDEVRACVLGGRDVADLLRQIGDLLSDAGYSTFSVEKNFIANSSSTDRLAREIDAAECLIVVVSDDEYILPWISFAIARAFAADKKILPIRVGDARIPAEAHPFMQIQVHGLQLTQAEVNSIVAALHRLKRLAA